MKLLRFFKARYASVMLVLTFVGLVLPIVVADFVSKKERRERQSQMLSLLQLIGHG